MTDDHLSGDLFAAPAVRLSGSMDETMLVSFREQLAAADERVSVVELFTLGGDPDVARTMGDDVARWREAAVGRRLVFLGKAAVYSAGVTFMSFFPRKDRYLAAGARLLIHERQMQKTVRLEGPLSLCGITAQRALHEIEASQRIQSEDFARLIQGSRVEMADVVRRTPTDWYLDAAEAHALGLVEAVV